MPVPALHTCSSSATLACHLSAVSVISRVQVSTRWRWLSSASRSAARSSVRRASSRSRHSTSCDSLPGRGGGIWSDGIGGAKKDEFYFSFKSCADSYHVFWQRRGVLREKDNLMLAIFTINTLTELPLSQGKHKKNDTHPRVLNNSYTYDSFHNSLS